MAFFDAVPSSSAIPGAAPSAPAPAAPSVSPVTAAAPSTAPAGGFFGSATAPPPSAPPSSVKPGSFFDAVASSPSQTESSTTPSGTSTPSPYFYSQFSSGATEGASDELDTSGKPLLGYRNPGDASTSTDATRVDSTFDPFVAQPLTRDQYYNPRAQGLRDQYHAKLGIQPDQQLDHAMALTLGGSNQSANLRAIPTAENQAEGQFETDLAEQLKEGKISYADAQIEEAKNKGLQPPWMPPEYAPKEGESVWDRIGDYVKDAFGVKTAQAATTAPVSNDPQQESDRLTAAGKEIQSEADHLSSLKANLDTSDESAVDSFNAQAKDFNAKLATYQGQVNSYNNSLPSPTGESIDEKTGTDVPASPATANPIIRINNDTWDATQSVVNDSVQSIMGALSEWSPENKDDMTAKIANGIEGVLKGGADIAFSPVSIIMGAVKDVPILGPLAAGIGTLLGNIGEVAGSGAVKALNAMPILPQHKADLTPLVRQAGSLGAQILAGDFGTGGEGFESATAKLDTLQSNIRDLIRGSVEEAQHIGAWKTLGSPKTVPELESNYRQLAQQFHPDKPGGSGEAMTSINNAKQLMDEKGIPKAGAILRSKVQAATGMKPAESVQLPFERLPGHAPIYHTPFPAGMSVQPMEPVGFGEAPDTPESMSDLSSHAADYVADNKDLLRSEYEQENGNVYNVDNMKDLIPGHIENPTMSEAFHKPAANLMGDMVNDKIKSEPGNRQPVVFMGGATGAGKSTAVQSLSEGKGVDGQGRFDNVHAVIDGTLADENRSRDQMRQSLKSGHPVSIAYVDNTPDRIIDNIISRAKSGGRTVPIETAMNSLQKSRQNVLRANGELGSNPDFKVGVIDNRGDVPKIVDKGIDYLKKNPYSDDDIAKAKQDAHAKVQTLYEQGKITPHIYEGLTRRRGSSSSQPVGTHGEEFEGERREGTPRKVENAPISIKSEAREAEISSAVDRIAASKDPDEIARILREDLKYPARAGFTAEGRGTGPDKIGPLADKLSTIASPANVRRILEGEDLTRKPSKDAFMERLPPDLNRRATALETRRQSLSHASPVEKSSFQSDHARFQKDLKDYMKVEKTRESAARSARFQRDKRTALQEADKIANKERYKAALRDKVKENAVRDSVSRIHKKTVPFEALRKDLNPLKFQDAETQGIIKEWRGNLLASKELAQEEFAGMAKAADKEGGQKFEDDMPTIHAYQRGELPQDQMNAIRAPFDKMYTEAYDRGVALDYHKNYLPQVWANSPEDVLAAAKESLSDKGLSEDSIESYLKGNELDIEMMNRLKMSRFFEQSKIFENYAEGEKFGLVPKYKNIPALAAYYREIMEATIANRTLLKQLAEAGKISPAETAPPHWVNLNAKEFRDFRGPAKLADMVDGFLRDESRLDSMQKLTKGIATSSKFLQEMALTAGVPFTNIHPMGIGMAMMAFEKMTGGLLTLRPDIFADELKNVWSIIRSNSNDASARYFESNQKYMTMMARQRLEVGEHVARYDKIYGDVARSGMLKKAIGAAHDIFNKVFTEKMFASTLPQLNIETFKSTYHRLVADGIEDQDAQKLAADIVRKSFGMSDFTMRSKDTADRLNALFFAPRFRENMVGAYVNAGKSFNFKDASLARSRAFVVGFALMYAAYNYLNHKLNGNYMWDNPAGRATYLRIPAPNGNVVYVPFNPSTFAVLRNVIEGGDDLIHGQFVPAAESAAQDLSMPFQMASQMITNTNYFGSPIYNQNDTGPVKTGKLAAYAGAQFSPQWIAGIAKLIEGTNQPWLETLSEANALPLSFSTAAKEETGKLMDAKNAQTASSYQSHQDAEAAYAKMKGSPDAGNQIQSLQASDPALAAQVVKIANDDAAGLSANDRLVKSLGVSDGERAKSIAAAINALPDQASKLALWNRYEKLKIISPRVAEQLQSLVK